MVERRPQHAASKLVGLVLSSACPLPDVCPGRLPPSGCSHYSLVFLFTWSPGGHTRGPSVVFEAVDLPNPGPFHFLTLLIMSTFVLSLTQRLVLLPSLYVILNILLSMLVCATASLFCACLVSVQVSAPYVIAGCTHEFKCTHVSSGGWLCCF